MLSLYQRVKDANHKSPRLTAYLKRNPYSAIELVANDKNITLKTLKNAKTLKEMLKLGRFMVGDRYRSSEPIVVKPARIKIQTGRSLWSIICAYGGRRTLVGLGGVWRIDVTEKFIEEYLKYGMCSYTDDRHEYEELSPKIRKCKICGHRQKLGIVIERYKQWKDV